VCLYLSFQEHLEVGLSSFQTKQFCDWMNVIWIRKSAEITFYAFNKTYTSFFLGYLFAILYLDIFKYYTGYQRPESFNDKSMLTTLSVKKENNATWCPPHATCIQEALQKLIGMSITSHYQTKTMKTTGLRFVVKKQSWPENQWIGFLVVRHHCEMSESIKTWCSFILFV